MVKTESHANGLKVPAAWNLNMFAAFVKIRTLHILVRNVLQNKI